MTEIAKKEALAPSRSRQRNRKKKPLNFRLTERDYEILKAVNRYRYLRTGQIRRLLFPESTTPQTTRRRLRFLSDPGYRYLNKIEPYVQIGKGSAESAWYLDRGGEELLRALGVPLLSYSRKNSGRVRHQFLDHALDLSEFRLKLELALRDSPSIVLHRFTSDFEIKESATAAVGPAVYKLYHELKDPQSRNKFFIVYPDALIILRITTKSGVLQRLFFVEIDRGTKSLSTVRDTVIGYALHREQKVFQKFGKFSRFHVLFQTTSPTRAENIRKALIGIRGDDMIWTTDVSQVTKESILSGRIWDTHEGQKVAIM